MRNMDHCVVLQYYVSAMNLRHDFLFASVIVDKFERKKDVFTCKSIRVGIT